jgi:hypothetical protein
MAITFQIYDLTNPKAKAFLDYIKTLDFITVEKAEIQTDELTDEHLQILHERRGDRLTGNSETSSWDEVKDFARNRTSQ